MRATAWRPSFVFRERPGHYLSLLDATGVAGIFFFVLAMYLVLSPEAHRHRWPGVDLPSVIHAKSLPAALKEDAVAVVVRKDGSL